MIFRLVTWFTMGVMLDVCIILLRPQLPRAVEPLVRFWKELAIIGIILLYATSAFRAGRVRVSAPRGLIATWFLLVGMGVIGFLCGLARGTADPEQAVRALRTFYIYPSLFAIFVLPVRALPNQPEERLFHGLGVLTLVSIPVAMTQLLWSNAWLTSSWVNQATKEGMLDVRNLDGIFRPFGTFVSTFSYGHFCAVMTVFIAAYLMFHRRSHWLYWLLLPVVTAGLLISTVRASIIGAMVAVAYLTVVRIRVMEGVGIRIAAAVVMLIVCMAGPFAVAAYQEHGRSRSVGAAYLGRGSLRERIDDEWKPAFGRLKTAGDFAFGLGTGAIGASVASKGDRAGPFAYNGVDNYYLLILVNHGVLGLLVWGAFALQLYWLCLRGSMVRTEVGWFLNGVVAMILMDLGASLFRMLLAAPAEATIFWVFAGLAAVQAHKLVGRKNPISASGFRNTSGSGGDQDSKICDLQ